MLKSLYTRWINDWENQLAYRSTDRVVRPFEWGLDWAELSPLRSQAPPNGQSPAEYLLGLNQLAVNRSDEFFGYETPTDYRMERGFLRFSSPLPSPHPVNDVVHAQYFPAAKPTKKAVVVLPHWNASQDQHGGLCRGIAKFGITALRLSLPYHDFRMPAELRRADFAVSSNIGRTIHATRQAVADIRAAVDWLKAEGFERVGIVGTSLGSCYACLASAHDDRIDVNVFNHCSSYVADVVWTGLSTLHVKKGLEGNVELEQLRQLWSAISPVNYLDKLAKHANKKSLFIYTEFDTTFIPRLSKDIINAVKAHGIPNKVVALPCGHYTMGESPFKFMDGYQIISFLKRNL